MATTTAKRIIDDAAIALGALEEGEQLSGTAALDAFRRLTQMLEQWSLEGDLVPWRTFETFALSNKAKYSLGPSGDWDTVTPREILSAWLSDGAGNDYALELGQPNQYGEIVVKGNTARPRAIFVEQTWPQWTVRFSAIPYDPTVTLVMLKGIVPWAAISAAQLVASVEIPPGYDLGLTYNLAVHLAPMFNLELPGTVAALAQRTRDSIARHNARPLELRVDDMHLGERRSYDYDHRSGPGWPF